VILEGENVVIFQMLVTFQH